MRPPRAVSTVAAVAALVTGSGVGLGAAHLAASPVPGGTRDAGRALDEQFVRIALAIGVRETRVTATSAWRIYESDGATIVADGEGGDVWRLRHDGRRIRVVSPDGAVTDYLRSPLVIRPAASGGFVVHAGRRYRGELLVHASDVGVTLVNRLPIDEYLKGVVPAEIGDTRTMAEFAAAEAQAVAARSYAYVRLSDRPEGRWFDLRPTVIDQAYGGVDAETVVGTRAVESTAGLVLKYDGRIVNAPFHSTCGGSTAEAPEAWPVRGEPFLQRVSDRIPGTERFYCDISPRFRWTRELTGAGLDAAVARYLRGHAPVRSGGPGAVLGVAVASRTASGRVASVEITTSRGGPYTLRGNDARFVLRAAGGAILNSSWFDVEHATTDAGRLARLVLRGAGYGHGVGMCQWGAIGRARAGQDFRTILNAYFPGTVVEPVF